MKRLSALSSARRLGAGLLAAAALACVGCAAERSPVSAVPQSYSYVDEGRTLTPAPTTPAATADRFLRPTIDRPAPSLNATAAADQMFQ